MEIISKNKKIIIVSAIAIFLVLIGLFVARLYLNTTSITVNSEVPGAFFTLNDQLYKSPETVSDLKPGVYTITCHVEGFETYQKTIRVWGGIPQTINMSFKKYSTQEQSISDAETQWTAQDQKTAQLLNQQLKERDNSNPLTKLLPYFGTGFRLDYSVDDSGNVSYFLYSENPTLFDQNLSSARAWVSSQGINSSTITINRGN